MAFTSAKVASVSKSVARTARRSVSCQAQQANREQKIVQRRQLFSLLAGTLGVAALGGKAEALPTVEEMLENSQKNKELNDRKRAATSGANLERSRTVTDGYCQFPNNLIGCENLAELGDVKYLSDDLKLECEGTEDGEACRAKRNGSPPSFLGV
eukprot:CAMPEP_0182609688 /NCGR_PEP_ID=MMETSP1330-20130603/3916_1 /TAXON_ID=464278 /ORGANISM="Picochlorum sp., Strain RCC944" /LENGTH=154 /DNA_ID=CAMNT_0024828567 /DNA_START=87 /DNA_END=551 /DNA_ORIENTATION=+